MARLAWRRGVAVVWCSQVVGLQELNRAFEAAGLGPEQGRSSAVGLEEMGSGDAGTMRSSYGFSHSEGNLLGSGASDVSHRR